jgi:hypothetical protein
VGSTEIEKFSPRGEICIAGIEWTPVGAVIDEGLSVEDWRDAVAKVSAVETLTKWCLGDLLAFGERKYADAYREASETTGLEIATLYNIASVSKRVPREIRREGLSWSLHRAIAPHGREEQIKWLDRAKKNGLSTRELERKLKPPPEEPPAEFAGGVEGLPEPCPHCEGTGVRR